MTLLLGVTARWGFRFIRPEPSLLRELDLIVLLVMGRLRRVSDIADGIWTDFLWKRLRPRTVSRSGLPVTLSSLSDWDIFSELWVSGEYDEPILLALNAGPENQPVRIVDLGRANVGLFSLRCMEIRNQNRPQKPLDIVAVEGCAANLSNFGR